MALGSLIGGLAGGLLGGIGAKKQQDRQNAYYQQAARQLQPQNIFSGAETLNPWLMGALQGNQGMGYDSGYGQALHQIAQQPGYIDPSLMNMPFHLSAQRANQDMSRAQSILGRTMGGTGVSGLGNAYALANQASRTARDVGTAQNYALWREQQRRADLGMLSNMLQGTYGQVSQNAAGAGGFLAQQQAPINAWQIASNMLGGGMASMAPFMGQGGMPTAQAVPAGNPYGNAGSIGMQPANVGLMPGSQTSQWQGMGLMG